MQLSHVFYAEALQYAGRVDEALAQYRLACVLCPDLPWLRALEGTCLARSGQRRAALAIAAQLDRSRPAEYVDGYYMALLREALGERDAAFQELDRACQEGSVALSILNVDPKMDVLRADLRFGRFREFAAPQMGQGSGQAA